MQFITCVKVYAMLHVVLSVARNQSYRIDPDTNQRFPTAATMYLYTLHLISTLWFMWVICVETMRVKQENNRPATARQARNGTDRAEGTVPRVENRLVPHV